MNMQRVLTARLLILCAPRIVDASTLLSNPVLVVTPMTLDFGRVATNVTATKTFLVENIGSGKLVGTPTVAAPFKILSGGDYTLRENDAQVVTMMHKPTGPLLTRRRFNSRAVGEPRPLQLASSKRILRKYQSGDRSHPGFCVRA